MAVLDPSVSYDPTDPEFQLNPYAKLARIREEAPVQETPYGVVFFRFPEVRQMLTDPNLSADDSDGTSLRNQRIKEAGVGKLPPQGTMARVDPPDHTRLRKLVQMAFTPKAIEKMRPYAETAVAGLLDQMRGKDRVDLIREFAYGLPFNVISEMLGIPVADRSNLIKHTHAANRLMDVAVTVDAVRAAADANHALRAFLGEQINKKRQRPGDDILSALIVAEDAGDQLTHQEMIDTARLLYGAGHETTMNMIGNGVTAMLAHPEQLDAFKRGEVDVKNAVEEILRFDSPVQLHARITRDQPLQLGGVEIPPRTVVIGHAGSANHDPDRFGADADDLDLSRENARQHLSFGFGIHHCIGAALSRLEGEVAFPMLFEAFPDLALDPENPPQPRSNQFFRGLDPLPVRLA